MPQITIHLPDERIARLDEVTSKLHRSWAEIVRQTIERYLEDDRDLSLAVRRLRDPNDPVFDWDEIRDELVNSN